MAEESLDDQLKEIQIAREQAELEKLKEEAALGFASKSTRNGIPAFGFYASSDL